MMVYNIVLVDCLFVYTCQSASDLRPPPSGGFTIAADKAVAWGATFQRATTLKNKN